MGKRERRTCASKRPQWKRDELDVEIAWDLETRGAVRRSGYLDRWNVDEGGGEREQWRMTRGRGDGKARV